MKGGGSSRDCNGILDGWQATVADARVETACSDLTEDPGDSSGSSGP